MGWGSGSELMGNLMPIIEKYVPEEHRVEFYKEAVVAFELMDWDTHMDCCGCSKSFDLALQELYPDWWIFNQELVLKRNKE